MLVGGLPNHQTTPINTTNMSKKRHTKEAQIKAIREHEAGRSQAEVCKELNITAQTFYRWKKQLGMMTNPDVRRLKELEKECLANNAKHTDWECTREKMNKTAGGKALYMHCLPADRNHEVADAVLDGPLAPL